MGSRAYTSDLAIRGIDALKQGPGGRSSVSGVTATIFGCSGFLARYVANAIGNTGGQLVLPYRVDDTDVQHLRVMGDLGQVVMMPDFRCALAAGGLPEHVLRVLVGVCGSAGCKDVLAFSRAGWAAGGAAAAGCRGCCGLLGGQQGQPPNPQPPAHLPGCSIRDEEMVRRAISRSNVVINMVGSAQETWNYKVGVRGKR